MQEIGFSTNHSSANNCTVQDQAEQSELLKVNCMILLSYKTYCSVWASGTNVKATRVLHTRILDTILINKSQQITSHISQV